MDGYVNFNQEPECRYQNRINDEMSIIVFVLIVNY